MLPELIAAKLLKRLASLGIPENPNMKNPTMASITPISNIKVRGFLMCLLRTTLSDIWINPRKAELINVTINQSNST